MPHSKTQRPSINAIINGKDRLIWQGVFFEVMQVRSGKEQ